MSNTIKLGTFTIFTAFIISFMNCGESHARPIERGYDDSGHEVATVHMVPSRGSVAKPKKKVVYHKPAPKKPAPKPKSAPNPKPAPKKVTPKPKPKVDQATINRIKAEVKAELKAEQKAKHPSFNEAKVAGMKGMISGAIGGAIATAPEGGVGAVPAGMGGFAVGVVSYIVEHGVGL